MEDNQLVYRILVSKDINSYGEIVKRYKAMVFAKAMSVVRNTDLAGEITQETFIRAYTKLSDWQGGASIGPWLATIAVHLSINNIDKARRIRTTAVDNNIPVEEYSAEHEMMLQQMERAINSLQEPDRSIVKLHYYNNNTTKEIGDKLGLSASNVLVKLHRIRQRLKKQLKHDNNE